MLQNEEFIQEFVEETTVHIENIETDLLKINELDIQKEIINNIFRAVHSIKGTAGFFAFKNIVELAHSMESLFGKLRNETKSKEIDKELIDILFLSNDCLKSMINDINNSEQYDIKEILSKFCLILNKRNISEEKKENEIIVSQGEINIDFFNEQKQMIIEGLKFGHKVYKIELKLHKYLMEKQKSPMLLYKNIQAVGNIIKSNVNIENMKEEDKYIDDNFYYIVIFTSVLEKSLLPFVLDILQENIIELIISVEDNDLLKSSNKVKVIDNKVIDNKVKVIDNKVIDNKVKVIDNKVKVINKEEIDNKKVAIDSKEEMENIKPKINEQNQDSNLHKSREIKINEFKNDYKEKPNIEIKNKQNIIIEDTIRVHISLLNKLLNLASEMVLGRNQLLRIIDQNKKKIPGIEPILQNIDRITTELQEKVMQTRMQPIANIFNKFPRIIRDLSNKLGKKIEFKMEEINVDLDKSIIEELGDPLTHLVRNAVDHGIEMPDEREALGKNRTGSIILNAYHEGGYVNINIKDNGAGINIEKIKEKVIEKDWISSNELSNMTEKEILNLLFRPGFSTLDDVTDISGRGVGLDVVKTNIEKLGGSIEIFTKFNYGTTFRLLLPITLAIIPSLIIEVNNQKFACPQINIQEIVRIKPNDESRKIEYIKDSEVLRLRGKLLPIVVLSKLLGLNSKNADSDSQKIIRILVIKIGNKRYGIAVDIIHGNEEILVKPLPIFIKNCTYYSGVTIMGDGKTAMILDPVGIMKKANLIFNKYEEINKTNQLIEDVENMKELQDLLLFKCSGIETFAIDLSIVKRIEEIQVSQINRIGNKEFIKFRGQTLRAIRLEDYLPVSRKENKKKIENIDNIDNIEEKLFIIIPKLIEHPIGIFAEKINDTLQTSIELFQDDIKAKGLIGSAIINDEIVLLIDVYGLSDRTNVDNYKNLESNNKDKIILIVEDTPFFQSLLKTQCESHGFIVKIAQNGKEALEILYKEKIDLMISDIEMPIINGLELITKIREDEQLCILPAIGVSVTISDKVLYFAIKSGYDYVESKLDKEKLFQKINLALKKGDK